MLLKKLTLIGFKSFCDKTVFEFDAGITCVVGPNGCGKSNLVDAIKWVVGEQSPKSLRGRQMLDMIFNGSSTRKSSGRCQVDLHFDNTDKRLSSEHNEVVVSRRLYRSGESEYLINDESVRLRDVRELFMDTGIGVGAYSIIEQGRVDVLLQGKVLGVDAKSVVAEGLEDVVALHRLEARVHIDAGEGTDVPYVQPLRRRVGEHHQVVEGLLGVVNVRLIDAGALPALPPLRLDRRVVVT